MANSRIYVTQHRRRREQKTDYQKRLELLKSGITRLVVRKTLTRIIAQSVQYKKAGDSVLAAVSSSDLKKMGWKGNTANLKAAYLTGLLIGKKAKAKGIEKMILDKGLKPSTKGGKIYAVVKGVLDAGIDVPHSKEILPSDERIGGEEVDKIKKAI